jgi:hypothetical protein
MILKAQFQRGEGVLCPDDWPKVRHATVACRAHAMRPWPTDCRLKRISQFFGDAVWNIEPTNTVRLLLVAST